MALVVIAISWMIVAFKPITAQSMMYEQLVEYKANITNADDQIVVIGDSTGLSGIDPHVFEKHSSLKIHNLCLYGQAKPFGWYNLLQSYIQKNAIPKVVVIVFTSPTPSSFFAQHFEEIYIKFRYFHWHCFWKFPTTYNPFHCLSILMTRFTNQLQPLPVTISDIHFAKKNKGYMAFRGTLSDDFFNSQISHGVTTQHMQEGMQEVFQIKKYLEEKGIKVFLYLNAIPQKDLALPYYKDFYEGKVDNEIYTLPYKYFNDQTHLNHRGAKKNTKIFAEFLKNHGF